MKFSWRWLIVLLIVVLAVVGRFYQLGKVPIEINRDEASLGYTALSLLKTGREEHGRAWPINLESFGDWKLPGYVYTLIPIVKVFGLSTWSIKLPSAIAGVGVVILAWIITWQIGGAWVGERQRFWLASSVALLAAVSPWDIHLSHLAYEAHLAMLMMLSAVAIFLAVMEMNKNRWWLTLSTGLFGLTLFTYHSYQIFTPLLAIGLGFLYWPEVKMLGKKFRPIFISCLVIASFFSLLLVGTSLRSNQIKFAGLSIFDKSAYAPVIEINRGYFTDRNSWAAKLSSNYPVLLINQVQRNLASLYSTRFFFFEGGTHGSHDIPGTGKMYPLEFFLLLTAGFYLFTSWQNKTLNRTQKFLGWWLVAATVAPVITFEAAHTIRYSPALFALVFLSGFGLLKLLTLPVKQNWRYLITGLTSLVLVFSVFSFLSTYFVISPKRDINNQNWQMKRLVELVNDRQNQYDHILMPGPTWSPYIYFLFYGQTDPATLAQQITYAPLTNEGFRHVNQLGKINFEPVDWNNRLEGSTLYVIKKAEIPWDKLEDSSYQIEYTLSTDGATDEWILLSHR